MSKAGGMYMRIEKMLSKLLVPAVPVVESIMMSAKGASADAFIKADKMTILVMFFFTLSLSVPR